jgi:hypothetical protein
MVANFSEEEAMAHTKRVVGTTSLRRPTAPVYVVFDLPANQPNSVRAEHVPLTWDEVEVAQPLLSTLVAQAFQPNDLKPQATNG